MKFIILTLISFSSNFVVLGQEVDSSRLIFTSKLKCLESGVYNYAEIIDVSALLEGTLLKHRGFKNFSFILIKKRKQNFEKIPDDAVLIHKTDTIQLELNNSNESHSINLKHVKNLIIGDCDYILAYSKKSYLFYKLKGFYTNEFELFFQELKLYHPSSQLKRKNFDQVFEVEGLDLTCLLNIRDSDCRVSCYKRDRKAFNFP